MTGPAVREQSTLDRHVAIVLGVAIAWLVFATAFGVFLLIENRVRVESRSGASFFGACRVPGVSDDSTYGRGVWQSWPPGTRCERGDDLDIAPTAPKVWGRPGPWRGAAVIVLTLWAVAIVAVVLAVRARAEEHDDLAARRDSRAPV
jgi:hypothetical protein